MPLHELPAERVFGEIEKLLLQARRPSLGLRLLSDWGLLPQVAPELVPLARTPQDPEWHPEGDVWTHTLLAMDQARPLVDDLDRPRALAVMLGTLCHDLGKPSTTRFERGRLRSPGHEEAGLAPTESLLDRWNVHTLLGYDVRGQVLALVGNHLKPGQLYDDRERVGDGAIRRLAGRCEPVLLYKVARADCLGRTGDFRPVAMDWFLERVRAARRGAQGSRAAAARARRAGARHGAGAGGRPHRPRRVRAAARRRGDHARRGARGGAASSNASRLRPPPILRSRSPIAAPSSGRENRKPWP